ncbi:MAG: tetratricopeptide repeat protein [Planctomycetota bacterium]|jgi:tetratricopeptide (TPR) repeat protein
MKTTGLILIGMSAVVLMAAALITPSVSADDQVTLARYVPNDVFMFINDRSNPDRHFIDQYWMEVFDALVNCGIHEDVIEMFSYLLGELDVEQAAEVERIKNRALQLFDAVDWAQLACKETAFTERFVPPLFIAQGKSPILMANMAWFLRGTLDGAAKNYEGLVAILQALVDEVNKAVGSEVLSVDRFTQMGTQVAQVNLLKSVPTQESLPFSIGLRDDVIVMGMRQHLFNDVLAIMDGSSKLTSLADDPRFQAAFKKLPPARDLMTYFDMQSLVKPLRQTANVIINKVNETGDRYMHSKMPENINGLNSKAMAAYRKGDYEQALDLSRQAHKLAPENSMILYNLACFNAVAGNRNEALGWLEKAVEGGFYAPGKITMDSDLTSLHGDPRYEAALARAERMAIVCCAPDVCLNFAEEGEVYRLRMQVHQTYKTRDFERGLELIKQAYAINPKDAKVVYTLACIHTLLGHEEEGLNFLDKAVDAGFYCPQHMSKDPDLESVRNHERFLAAKAKAAEMAGEVAVERKGENTAIARRIIDRIANAVSILDYSATVESTEGFSTSTETIAMLVEDAKQRPIYKLFGNQPPMTDFDKYLPQETLSFSVSGGFDVGALYGFMEDTVRIIGPKGAKALAKWEEIQEQIGFNIREDVIDWIHGDSIEVTLEDGGSAMLLKVKDEKKAHEKISAALEFMTTKLGELIAKKPELAGLAMLGIRTSTVDHEDLEGFQNIHFSMAPEPAVWGVADGFLIFGSSADAIALCMATARGDHPSIRKNARAMQEAILPDGPFVAVSLSDRRGLGQELEAAIGIATMVTGMAGSFVPEPEARTVLARISGMLGKLTPVVRKIDFYKSAASCTTFDGMSWRNHAVTHYFSPEERAAKDM